MRARDVTRGLESLRLALACALAQATPLPATAYAGPHPPSTGGDLLSLLLAESLTHEATLAEDRESGQRPSGGSARVSEEEQQRLVALVDLARGGDKHAFGELYDHYHAGIYRFLFYRVGSTHVAEDLVGETFVRALRNIGGFQWQGKDFGAWLTTIARNLANDHFKAGRTRLERTTDDLGTLDSTTTGPESLVLSHLTNEALLQALSQLPGDQKDCLVMRFLQGLSIAETAEAFGRSPGAIKQLQLRAVRGLAQLMPPGLAEGS